MSGNDHEGECIVRPTRTPTPTTKKRVVTSQKFIINLFGESGIGKTTVLLRLIEMLRKHAMLTLEVSNGFNAVDVRSVLVCRSGTKSGVVCVCTSGDSSEILKQNIAFFKDVEADPPWKKLCKEKGKIGAKVEILVTAAHRPLRLYKKVDTTGFEVINIPIRVDIASGKDDWMSALNVPPEALLFNINYILKNGRAKRISSGKDRLVDSGAIRASISRN